MKNKNYYEILGVAPHVGSGQIQAAYRFARGLYSGEAMPTYGLLSGEERAQMLDLVEDAYAALSNPNVRRDYDAQLQAEGPPSIARRETPEAAPARDGSSGRSPASAPPAAPPPPGEGGHAASMRVPEVVNGSVLKKLREGRRLTVDQIAGLSKVGSRFLRALEEDRHDVLPGRVFARGFLIEYARALRVSETELVDRYLLHWKVSRSEG